MSWAAHQSRTNRSSRSDAAPRSWWLKWAAAMFAPRSRHHWSSRSKRHMESSPPDTAHSAVSPRPGSTHRGQRESSSSMSAPHFSKSDLSPRRTVCPASRTWCTPAVPHGAGRRGGPFLSQSSGEVNSPSGKVSPKWRNAWTRCRAAPLCGADKPQSSSYLVSNVENVVYSGIQRSSTLPVSPWRFLATMHSAMLCFSESSL